MPHGLNIAQALDKFLLPQLRLDEIMMELAKDPFYTAFSQLVEFDDPAGDVIYHIYSEPLAAMPEWQGPRHVSEVDFRYWQSTVRTFADSMLVDVDDIKPDSGSPAKLAAYRQRAARMMEAALLIWPQLFVQAIKDGGAVSKTGSAAKTWLPDGANIFDNHPIKPNNTSLGYFRNYRSKDTTGGSAAYAITYANELAVLKAGLGFKAPNGLEMPIRYDTVVTSASNVPLLSRLLKDDYIPSWEATGQTAGSSNQGGAVPNEIRRYYGGEGMRVIGVANMPSTMRLYMDTSRKTEMPLRMKERQPITWQYQGVGGPSGAFPVGNDEGAVDATVFEENAAKFGPKARGECYPANWWRMFLCDSTP